MDVVAVVSAALFKHSTPKGKEYPIETILLERYGPFMDLEELADLMRIKKQSMYQQIYRGQLDVPHVRRGKKYLFPTQEVAKYFTSQLSPQPEG